MIKGLFKFILFVCAIIIFSYISFVYGQIYSEKSSIELDVPINKSFNIEVDQIFDFPISLDVELPINETFQINEKVPINTKFLAPIALPTGTINVEVPINQITELNFTLDINQPITITKTLIVNINKTLSIPINKNLTIPVDNSIRTKISVPDWILDLKKSN
jgi:hypothetical protein